ncbi:MAG: hypothetical protein NC043_05820 [Muribaculaceae bacterium]|nr:hypothetical protein [Muribaculaceae bacterium]
MENTENTELCPAAVADESVSVPAVPAPESDTAQPAEPSADIASLLAEAEQRGYLRGLNERAAESMNTPRLWENPRRTEQEAAYGPDADYGFLANIRPGVWD